jgi:S1-C subfamily serine protease
MANVDERRRLTLTTTLSAVEFTPCSPGVFYIERMILKETCSERAAVLHSSSGTAVTNYHVIAGADTV